MKYYLLLASVALAPAAYAQDESDTVGAVQQAATDAAKDTAVDAATTGVSDTALPEPAGGAVTAVVPDVQEPVTVTLPAQTPVLFRMDNRMATDKREKIDGEKLPKNKRRITNEGETFTMSVVEDVLVDGVTVIPKGAKGHGEVIRVSGRGGFGKSGKLEIQMNTLEIGGKNYEMQGTYLQKGKGRFGSAAAGMVIGGAIVGAFIKGSQADIPVGAEISFSTGEDISVSGIPASAAPVLPEEAAATAAPAVEAVAPEGSADDQETPAQGVS